MSDDTGQIADERDDKGRFLPGNTESRGRPPNARNKLSNAFIEALSADFEEHGTDVIEELRAESPSKYCNVIARLMPKLLELSGPDGSNIPLGGTVRFQKVKKDEPDE